MVTKEESKKAVILQKHLDGLLTIKEVAESLGLSERQVYRLKKSYCSEGMQAVTHKNRGKKCSFCVPDNIRKEVVAAYTMKEFSNSNFTHFTELFNEMSGYNLSRSTVRRILLAEGFTSSKRQKRKRKAHPRRERRTQRGMLVQTDGSRHRWLGKEHGYFCLMAAIDDATGIVEAAFLYQMRICVVI